MSSLCVTDRIFDIRWVATGFVVCRVLMKHFVLKNNIVTLSLRLTFLLKITDINVKSVITSLGQYELKFLCGFYKGIRS